MRQKIQKLSFFVLLSLFIFVLTSHIASAGWTQQVVPGVTNWGKVVSSSDGLTLAAYAYTDGFIYTSTDGGDTWTKQNNSGSRDWRDLASSADGMRLVGVVNNGYIYTSSDGGITWTERTGADSRQWRSVASSSDGMKIIAGPYLGYGYTSIDGGVTWTEQTAFGEKNWVDVASSADGTKLVLASPGPNYIYTSSDGGVTWTERTGAGERYWIVVASSADGTKLVAGDEAGYIYTSSDGGVTWTERTGAGAKYWNSLASSADGSSLVVSISDGGDYSYTSDDFGVTWQAETSIGTITGQGVAISADGNKKVVLTNGSHMWTYVTDNTPPVASSVSISGVVEFGQILTGLYTYTDTEGDTEGISTFRWLRNGVPIVGASSTAYTVVVGDIGATLTFEVTPVATSGVLTGSAVVSSGSVVSAALPTLGSSSFSSINQSSFTVTTTLSSTGGVPVTQRGVEYGLTQGYGNSVSENGSFSTGDFSFAINNLSCGTTYYIRPFAVNARGTQYGSVTSVLLTACPGVVFPSGGFIIPSYGNTPLPSEEVTQTPSPKPVSSSEGVKKPIVRQKSVVKKTPEKEPVTVTEEPLWVPSLEDIKEEKEVSSQQKIQLNPLIESIKKTAPFLLLFF